MMPRSAAQSPAPTGKRLAPGATPSRHGPKDLTYLLRPEIYHPSRPSISPSIPQYRQSTLPDTPIPDLLARGHFRAAAIAATHALTSGSLDPTDHAQIFELLYTRLACLTLIDATTLAAQEVKALGDLHKVEERVVSALCDMADGEYELAFGKWTALRKESDDEMVGVNLAVCMLYVGKMSEGKTVLESLTDSGRSSHTLLFNLSTMYELCTDRSRALKVKLSEKVAAMEERADGWEKTNADFKL
ncbi:hypothetical protein N0V88_006888 [Collariella sp. IMI 366227]|nr:hypothetical protein N0V88_006888 [Collariella sp. IMI 366227]